MFERIILIGSAIVLFLSSPCSALEDQTALHLSSHQSKAFQEIKQITRRILLKEIELERFNIDYRKHASVQALAGTSLLSFPGWQ